MVPLHSYKFIATLQHTLAGYPGSPQRNPLILRVDSKAGHGGGEWNNFRNLLQCSLWLHGCSLVQQPLFAQHWHIATILLKLCKWAACAGKPTGKVIEEYSDLYGFAAKAMSAKWVLQKPTGTKPVEAAG